MPPPVGSASLAADQSRRSTDGLDLDTDRRLQAQAIGNADGFQSSVGDRPGQRDITGLASSHQDAVDSTVDVICDTDSATVPDPDQRMVEFIRPAPQVAFDHDIASFTNNQPTPDKAIVTDLDVEWSAVLSESSGVGQQESLRVVTFVVAERQSAIGPTVGRPALEDEQAAITNRVFGDRRPRTAGVVEPTDPRSAISQQVSRNHRIGRLPRKRDVAADVTHPVPGEVGVADDVVENTDAAATREMDPVASGP